MVKLYIYTSNKRLFNAKWIQNCIPAIIVSKNIGQNEDMFRSSAAIPAGQKRII